MMVSDAVRIRLIRAYLGMDSKSFAARLGVNPGTMTNYERGRSSPTAKTRVELMKLCDLHKICFSPDGYPFPASCVIFNQKTKEGE